jgi:hypothetical protein
LRMTCVEEETLKGVARHGVKVELAYGDVVGRYDQEMIER